LVDRLPLAVTDPPEGRAGLAAFGARHSWTTLVPLAFGVAFTPRTPGTVAAEHESRLGPLSAANAGVVKAMAIPPARVAAATPLRKSLFTGVSPLSHGLADAVTALAVASIVFREIGRGHVKDPW
jgi:hypothetical protein